MSKLLEREEINNRYLRIFLQKETDKVPRRVRFPESVDVEKGEVRFWVINPPDGNLQVVDADTNLTKLEPPAEIEGAAKLQVGVGKVFVVNEDHNLLQRTP